VVPPPLERDVVVFVGAVGDDEPHPLARAAPTETNASRASRRLSILARLSFIVVLLASEMSHVREHDCRCKVDTEYCVCDFRGKP
jgi:hypothetical protein